jgi:D-arabinose 1-dehydrogenase-like Zn-dependent alcohol dehydrogenase
MAPAKAQQSATELRGSKLATELPAVFEGETFRYRHNGFLTQHRVFRQHPIEIGAQPVGQLVGLDRSAKPARIALDATATFEDHQVLIGASLTPSGTGLDPLLLIGRGITLASISVGSRANFEAMNRAIAMHRRRPVIDRTFRFADAKDAYRHFEGRGHFGKVAIAHG